MDWQLVGVLAIVIIAAVATVGSFARRRMGCASCASPGGTRCGHGTCCCENHGTTHHSNLVPLERRR